MSKKRAKRPKPPKPPLGSQARKRPVEVTIKRLVAENQDLIRALAKLS